MNLKTPAIAEVWSTLQGWRMVAWCVCVFLVVHAQGQTNHGLLKKADQSYIKQDFNKAEENYRKAMEKKSNEVTKYNLGNSIMEQNRPDEAATLFEDAAKKQNNLSLKSKAWHNLGNALFQKKDFENSINAYKESLKIIPEDLDTKKNLVLAKKQLLKQQQQQQQNQQQNQEPPKDQNQEDQQQQQPSSGQDDKGKKEQKKESASQPQQMTKEEAEQLLQYTEREDQRVQQKLRNKDNKSAAPKKDW